LDKTQKESSLVKIVNFIVVTSIWYNFVKMTIGFHTFPPKPSNSSREASVAKTHQRNFLMPAASGSSPSGASSPSGSGGVVTGSIRLLTVIIAKSVIVFLLTLPFAAILSLLSQPFYAHILSFFLTVFFASVVALGMANKQHKERGFKLFFFLLLVFVVPLVLYYFGVTSEFVFVRVLAFFGVVSCQMILFMSVFVGKRKHRYFEHGLFGIGLIFPIVAGVISLFGGEGLYKIGILVSVICSLINMLFNKSGFSIGVPDFMRTPSATDLAAMNESYIIKKNPHIREAELRARRNRAQPQATTNAGAGAPRTVTATTATMPAVRNDAPIAPGRPTLT
jgi:hypothetical protein